MNMVVNIFRFPSIVGINKFVVATRVISMEIMGTVVIMVQNVNHPR